MQRKFCSVVQQNEYLGLPFIFHFLHTIYSIQNCACLHLFRACMRISWKWLSRMVMYSVLCLSTNVSRYPALYLWLLLHIQLKMSSCRCSLMFLLSISDQSSSQPTSILFCFQSKTKFCSEKALFSRLL